MLNLKSDLQRSLNLQSDSLKRLQQDLDSPNIIKTMSRVQQKITHHTYNLENHNLFEKDNQLTSTSGDEQDVDVEIICQRFESSHTKVTQHQLQILLKQMKTRKTSAKKWNLQKELSGI